MNSHGEDIASISQHGYQLLRENRPGEAVVEFERVLERDPGNCYALVGIGDAARKQGDYSVAIDHYQECLTHDADNTYALFGLADSFKALKQYGKAIDAWERYLKLDSSNVTVLTRVADVYRKIKDRDRAKELYLSVLRVEEQNPYALIGLAHLHYDFREYQDALFYWERMLEIDGERVDIRVLTSLGNCHRKLKQFRTGLPYFEQAKDREPTNFYALFGLADCYRGLNDPERSLEFWNAILKLDPDNKVILTRAGDAHRVLSEYPEAESCYQRALEIDYDLYAVLGLALIKRKQGEPEEAIRDLEGLVDREPRNPRVFQELAQAHLQAGRPEEALSILKTFKKTGIHNAFVDEMIERIERE